MTAPVPEPGLWLVFGLCLLGALLACGFVAACGLLGEARERRTAIRHRATARQAGATTGATTGATPHQDAVAPASTPPALRSVGASEPPPLPLAQWWPLALDALHIRLIGPTASGKSTLARALAAALPGQLALIDPLWRPGSWDGLPCATVAPDGEFSPIAGQVDALLAELRRRGAALQAGTTNFTPLVIVWDEIPACVDEIADAGRLVRRVGQRGRHVGMRLIGLAQSDRVRAWGLEGHGDAAGNFVTIYMGRAATERCPAQAGADRPACLDRGDGRIVPISLDGLPALADRPITPDRAWRPTAPDSPDRDRCDRPIAPVQSEPAPAPAPDRDSPVRRRLSDDRRDRLVVALARRGWSQDRIRAHLRSSGYALAQDRLVALHRQGRAQRSDSPRSDSPRSAHPNCRCAQIAPI